MLLHERVHKTPADGGIKQLGLTLERRAGFAHHKRRPRHRFHAAGNHQIRIPGFDGACGKADRIQAGTTQPVDGGAGDALRVARQQRRHMRHVAVIFPGLVRAAENHIIDSRWIETRITAQQLSQRNGG